MQSSVGKKWIWKRNFGSLRNMKEEIDKMKMMMARKEL
jgi:hypothetical protein